MQPKFSILMPTYNHGAVIEETIQSILDQDYDNFEIIVSINGESSPYSIAMNNVTDERVKWQINPNYVNYGENLFRAFQYANGDHIIYFASDDIMGSGCLSCYSSIVDATDSYGAILRTYFAFSDDVTVAVREKPRFQEAIREISIDSGSFEEIMLGFSTLDQLSGLCFPNPRSTPSASVDIFTCHAYPVLESIMKSRKFHYVSDDFLAVRIGLSQSRTISDIYDKSPMASWNYFLDRIFVTQQDEKLRVFLKKYWIGSNIVGLFQITNFSKKPYKFLLREVKVLLGNRPLYIFNPAFHLVFIMCVFLPKEILIRVVDFCKITLLRLTHRSIRGRGLRS